MLAQCDQGVDDWQYFEKVKSNSEPGLGAAAPYVCSAANLVDGESYGSLVCISCVDGGAPCTGSKRAYTISAAAMIKFAARS